MLNEENTKNRNFNYVSRDLERTKKKCSNKNFLKPQRKQHGANQHYICVKICVSHREKKNEAEQRSSFIFNIFCVASLVSFYSTCKEHKMKNSLNIYHRRRFVCVCVCFFYPHSFFTHSSFILTCLIFMEAEICVSICMQTNRECEIE